MVMSAFLRPEMILESYAEVDCDQFTTENTLHQLVQCSTVPNNKPETHHLLEGLNGVNR